jgi:tetratricopeptide (TPR) repeat protein/O-antigen ligase
MDESTTERKDRAGMVILGLLCLLIIASPLAIGCVSPLGRSAVVCAAAALSLLWFLREARLGRVEIVKTWAWLPVGAWFALLALQMTPLPAEWVGKLSPGSLRAWQATLGTALPERLTISLHPYGTLTELLRTGAICAVFFVTLHTVREKKHAVVLVVALVGIAFFESLYGMAQRFTGRSFTSIQSGSAESTGSVALAGSFWSKNNLAALLSMAALAGAGLLMATFMRDEQRGRATRAGMIEALSSSGAAVSVTLGMLLLAIGVALCLTLSRGALGATFLAAVVFAICAVTGAQSRRYALYMVILGVAVVIALLVVGMEVVAARMEDVASGRAASWGDRLNMLSSGWAMFKDYSLFGAGVGAFRFVFEQYQSARFGDYIVDYIHCDWAQVLCDTGAVGMAIVLAATLLLVVTTFVAALRQKDLFARWLALGSVLSVAALLVHSVIDFNLSKVTSNGIALAVLLGIAYSMARAPSEKDDAPRRRMWRIPLGPPAVRWGLGLAAVVLAASVCWYATRMGAADVAVNKAAAGVTRMSRDIYFFLSLEADLTDAESAAYMARAGRLDGANPQVWFQTALYRLGTVENSVMAQARQRAKELLGERAAEAAPERVEMLARGLAVSLEGAVMAERLPELRAALADARKAAALLPSAAKYHLLVADLASRLMELTTGAESQEHRQLAQREAGLARALAPRKPAILFRTGRIELQCAALTANADDRRKLEASAIDVFRRAIVGNPAYTSVIYPLVQVRQIGGESPLLTVTPVTPRAYERLSRVLWERGMWEDLLRCLATLEELYAKEVALEDVSPWMLRKGNLQEDADAPSLADADYVETDLYQMKSDLERWRFGALQRRAAVLGILGRWEEWRAAVGRCRDFLGKTLAERLAEAVAARQRHEFDTALAGLRRLVRADCANPEYLLALADLCHAMKRPSVEPNWEGALNLLYRIVIANDRLTPETLTNMRALVDRIGPQTPEDRALAAFIVGAGEILAGDAAGGVRTLEALSAQKDKAAGIWRQRHLIWLYLGMGYERTGSAAQALAAYRRVAEMVPGHREALQRIAALDPANAWVVGNALRDLSPETTCAINFGGKLILRGYTLSQDITTPRVWTARAGKGDWYLTCFWEARDRVSSKYVCGLQLLSAEWSPVADSQQRIRNGGKLYPVDFPRCGEMIVDRIRLEGDPREARYLKLNVSIPERGLGETALLNDCGQAETILTLWPRSDRTGARTPPVTR